MGRIQVRSLDSPDETIPFPLGHNEIVRLGDIAVGRDTHQPGWHWAEHVKPIVETEWCEFQHRGVVVQGQMGVRMADGEEAVIGPYQAFDIPPGHDGWVVGDEPLVTLDWTGVEDWAKSPAADRVLTTILFSDIVGSTQRVHQQGDAAWRRVLARHDDTVRSILASFRGHEVETAGDSFLATFDSAARAVRCGRALVVGLQQISVPIRVGIHTGEVEMAGDRLRGVAVHIAARIMGLAGEGAVLVSATTQQLCEGSDLRFVSAGTHTMKGVEGARALFSLDIEPYRGHG
jgi:class 3 adenylate cyclase